MSSKPRARDPKSQRYIRVTPQELNDIDRSILKLAFALLAAVLVFAVGLALR